MKKLILLSFVLISLNVAAQFNTGSIYFSGITGGAFGYQRENYEDFVTNDILYDITLEGGYFIKNKLSVGGAISTGGSHINNYFRINGIGEHNFIVGPVVRYYKVWKEDFHLYFTGNPYIGFGTAGGNAGIRGGAGVNYFLTERLAIEARATAEFSGILDRTYTQNLQTVIFEIGISAFFPSISFFDMTN